MSRAILTVFLILFTIYSQLVSAQDVMGGGRASNDAESKNNDNLEEDQKEDLVFLDLHLFQDEIAISKDRLIGGNIGAGFANSPLVETIKYRNSLLYAGLSKHTATGIYSLEGGILEGSNTDDRKNKRVKINFEDSIFHIIFGVSGLFEQGSFYQESEDNIFNGIRFSQRGYGSNIWTGFRIGMFNSDFLAFRIGGGKLWSSGKMLFDSSHINGLEPLPIYEEYFNYNFVSIEGQSRWKYLNLGVNTEYGIYDRVFHSPDIARFGYNVLRELTVISNIELNPFPFQDIFSIAIIKSINLMKGNDLMIRNKPEYLKAVIRLKLS
jgi:hypothetical protein